MKTDRSIVPAILSHGLPLAHEAALLFANGRATDAADALTRALDSTGDPELWELLFDLYRAQGNWRAFESLAGRYVQATGAAAPQWVSDEEWARLPAELRPQGAAYFEIAGTLDARRTPQLSLLREASSKHATLHLDVSKIGGVDADGCAALLDVLGFLANHGNGVLFSGADRLGQQLHEAAEGSGDPGCYWRLLLELHRLRGQQAEFERTALEYALAVGATPPPWQPVLMPVAAPQAVEEKRDEPRYQAGPEVLHLVGTLTGGGNGELGRLREFAEARQYVNLNLSQVARMDFGFATSFVDSVNELADEGKTVRLIRPHSLIRALLASFSLDPRIALIAPKSGVN